MPVTIRDALAHKLISVDFLDPETGIAKFRIGTAPTVITARVVKNGSNLYSLEVSHKVKTPCQAGPYMPGFRDCPTPDAAMRELIRAFCAFYNQACERGHHPDGSWFVNNPYYEP